MRLSRILRNSVDPSNHDVLYLADTERRLRLSDSL